MEPTEHAETTRYPAGDHSLSAPEHDDAVTAPQVAVDHGPEVYYDDTSPEATNGSEKETVDRSVPRIVPQSFWRRKGIVIIALLSILIAVVIVVGSVVGTMKAKKSSHTSSKSDPLVSTLVSTTSRSSPQPTAFPKNGGILNDSSFAAVTLQNNDRRLFFQDQEGVVKQAIYSDAMKHWNAAFSNVVASDARNHTPFAVHSVLPAGDQLGSALTRDNKSEMIYLFYISTNNTLALTRFSDGSWEGLRHEMNTNVSVATDSTYLSTTKILNQSSFEVCLFFEDSNGKVSALHGLWALLSEKVNATYLTAQPSTPTASSAQNNLPDSFTPVGSPNITLTGLIGFKWTWEDNTRKLRAALPNNNFSAPFSSSVSPDGGVLAMFSNLNDDDTYSLNAFMTDFVNGTFKAARASDGQPIDKIDRSTPPFDLLQISPTQGIDPLLFWINGTKLEIQQAYSGLATSHFDTIPDSGPETGFPYSRLGGTVPFNATAYYLYHQLDDVTIAEETWSLETGVWVLSNITVGTS